MSANIKNVSKRLEPWKHECHHDNESHPRLDKERSAAGQQRRSIRLASALAHSPQESAQAVAKKLRTCAPNHRCGSGFCPSCTWATNRWFRKIALAFANTATAMLFSTVQLPDQKAMPANLEELDPNEQKLLLANALDKADLGRAIVFGAMDLSLNIWLATGARYWSAHWALFTPDRHASSVTTAISRILHDSALVHFPVKTRAITHTPDRVFSYAFKNVFDKKLIPLAQDGHNGNSVITPDDPEFDTLAVNLDRIGIMPRFFSQRCTFAEDQILSCDWRR